MNAMLTAFAAIVVIAIVAGATFNAVDWSSAEQNATTNTRLQ